MKKKLIILFSIFLLSGCAATNNLVTTFSSGTRYSTHELKGNERGNLLLLPAKKGLEDDLIYKNYSKAVSQYLTNNGLTVVNDKKDLKYVVFLNYGFVSARSISKKRRFKVNKKIFFKNPLEIFNKTKVDILFEAIGMSDGISKKVVETALKNRIHVITPNKALISKHGDYLGKLAEENNVNLEFEASVAGGIPILRTIKEGLATNKISKVYGILNGTSNYILSEMENSNDSFSNVLKKLKNWDTLNQVTLN